MCKVGERSLPSFLAREDTCEGCWKGMLMLLRKIGVNLLVTRTTLNVISLWFLRGK